MKTKLRFLKMVWQVMTNKQKGWIFFHVSKENQEALIYGSSDEIDIKFRYLGVDKRVVDIITSRLEKSVIIEIENNYSDINLN